MVRLGRRRRYKQDNRQMIRNRKKQIKENGDYDQRMKKIKITRVAPETKTHNGLFDEGCYGCDCDDECCEYGCDVDLGTLKVILKHRDQIEPLIKRKIENCFQTPVIMEDDYIGGGYRSSAVRKSDNRCVFHLRRKRGCSLFYIWSKKLAPKTVVPTICRIFPLTWHHGALFIDSPVRKKCKASHKTADGKKPPSLFETQIKDLRALFDIKGLK